MRWVTRAHVHVDRVACPWLLQRFVDSNAKFFFVARNLVDRVAAEEDATPFDVTGAELGHQGNGCSFDAIIAKHELKDPALLRLAVIIRAADTGTLADDPIAAGLEAIATGFSLRYPDDEENLAMQFEIYDALYAWCRLQVAR